MDWGTRSEGAQDAVGDLLRADSGHALVGSKGAGALKARAARQLMPQYGVLRPERTGENRLRGTKDADRGHPKRSGEVHGAGVVRDEQVALAQVVDQLPQACFAHEVLMRHLGADEGGQLLAQGSLARRAVKLPMNARPCGADLLDNLGEAIQWPAFGLTVLGSGADAQAQWPWAACCVVAGRHRAWC